MCGIAGIFSAPGPGLPHLESAARAMTASLVHRGPDDSGLFCDVAQGIAMGHRRLSILDLSPLGHQPMASRSGRYTVVFNGEVYNYKQLRSELEPLGHGFRGESDTEVLLAAFEQWGQAALSKFNGMFALALWDAKERALLLARDRMGKKPLYYGLAGSALVFGSELKALCAHPDFDPALDRDALGQFFRYGCIPAPASVYRMARKLPPAHSLTLRHGRNPLEATPYAYWSVEEAFVQGLASPFRGGLQEAQDELARLLLDATSLRMVSDVPLGAFLSGGVDSSLVTALMQANSSRPVKTFSIGFTDARYNEAPHARAVARHLGCDHTERILDPSDLLQAVPHIPRHYDEPFADCSQIPTLLVCRVAREQVTVALSGDGGDELFNGYERHQFLAPLWRKIRAIPRPMRAGAGALAGMLPDGVFSLLGPLGPKIRWRLGALGAKSFEEFYRFLLSHFRAPGQVVRGAIDQPVPFGLAPEILDHACGDDQLRRMGLIDHLRYLPDDILAKVDRASMAASLEVRCPLLDHRVVEFAASLPTQWKVAGGKGKAILRSVLHRHVPEALVERPKMGFGVPVAQWMRTDLRDWCEGLLDESALRAEGVLDAGLIRRIWAEYLAGQTNWFPHLWDVLMYRAWRLEWPGRTA